MTVRLFPYLFILYVKIPRFTILYFKIFTLDWHYHWIEWFGDTVSILRNSYFCPYCFDEIILTTILHLSRGLYLHNYSIFELCEVSTNSQTLFYLLEGIRFIVCIVSRTINHLGVIQKEKEGKSRDFITCSLFTLIQRNKEVMNITWLRSKRISVTSLLVIVNILVQIVKVLTPVVYSYIINNSWIK